MNFEPKLIPATLVQRYKRFLADVMLADGSEITVHCPNPGAMLGLNEPGSKVWISDSGNPKRKLRHTLELLHTGETLVGINTNTANKLVREAMESGMIEEIGSNAVILPEQKYGENSRIDFLVEALNQPPLYVEVKNVHFVREKGLHEFPDSPTARGTKHLGELINQVRLGNRAMMIYLIQRDDGDRFAIAGDKDPAYASAFSAALDAGVEMRAIRCAVSPGDIVPERMVQIVV